MTIFKRLKLFDYLLIASLLLFGIILYNFFHPKEKWIQVSVFARDLSIFQASSLHVGDIEKDPFGKESSKITNIQKYDSLLEIEKPITNSNKNLFIGTVIKVKINPRTNEYEYKNKIIKVGSPIEFLFSSGYVRGTIIEVEGVKQDKKSEVKVVTLKLYSRWPWFADSIKLGAGRLDENNQKVIEIISKEVAPAEKTVTTSSGENLIRTDPRQVDITLKVRMHTQRFGDDYVYRKDTPILIGENISFNADNSRIDDAFIVNIE